MREGNKTIKVTPCCKSSQWDFGVGKNFENFVRCRLCDKKHDFANMLEVVRGYNPTTYFCDKCYDSELEQHKREKNAI